MAQTGLALQNRVTPRGGVKLAHARKLAVPYLVLDYLLKLSEQTSKLSNLSLHLRKHAPRGFADPYRLRDQSFQLVAHRGWSRPIEPTLCFVPGFGVPHQNRGSWFQCSPSMSARIGHVPTESGRRGRLASLLLSGRSTGFLRRPMMRCCRPLAFPTLTSATLWRSASIKLMTFAGARSLGISIFSPACFFFSSSFKASS
jgi:hypothetical protein